MFYYAQLNEDNICVGISQLNQEMKQDDLIPITLDQYNHELLSKKYKNGQWIGTIVEPEPGPIPEPNPINEIKENQIIIMLALADIYEMSRR